VDNEDADGSIQKEDDRLTSAPSHVRKGVVLSNQMKFQEAMYSLR